MKIKLIKRQILDEREEQLVNKAGMKAFSLLLYSSLALYAGSVAMNAGAIHYQSFSVLIAIASLYFMCRAQYLGVNYYNSFSLTIWGLLVSTGFMTFLIAISAVGRLVFVLPPSVFRLMLCGRFFHTRAW